jgi:phosphoglycerol transferase
MSARANQDVQDDNGREAPARLRVADVLLGQRVRPLWIMALYGFLIFPIFRVVLFLVRREAVQDTTISEIGRCFGYGLQFDAVVVGYALLPMVVALCLAPASAFTRNGFRRTITVYGTGMVVLALFVEAIGAAFILDYRRRLNWAALAYFSHPREVIVYVWKNYPFWLLLLLMAVLMFVVYRLLRRHFWRGKLTCNSLRQRLCLTGVLTAVFVLACRGTLGSFPLRPGAETHSPNNWINQLSSNNFFSLYHAGKSIVKDGRDEEKYYDFPQPDQALQVATKLLVQTGDTVIAKPGRPLLRRVETHRPRRDFNVVVIIMEGQSSRPVGALGYTGSHTPNLDRLCREGMSFDRMYAVGARTSRAMVGVLCGHPDLGGMTLLERDEVAGMFRTLPSILAERGYRTVFVYGGNPDFDNMKDFFLAGGIKTVIGQKEIDEKQANTWGVPDEMIFKKAHEMFVSMGDQRFFAAILTVSNHKPYEIPSGRPIPMLAHADKKNNMLNAYRYADWALDEFFQEARKAAYFDNTVFVLVADHGHGEYLGDDRAIDVPGYRVPCVFYAPGIIPTRRIGTIASQTDIAPTLLGLLGGTYKHSFLGRDICKVDPSEGFALLHEGRNLGFVRSRRALVLSPKNVRRNPPYVPVLFDTNLYNMDPIAPDRTDPNDVSRLQRQMFSLYWMALAQYLSVAEPSAESPKGPQAFFVFGCVVAGLLIVFLVGMGISRRRDVKGLS